MGRKVINNCEFEILQILSRGSLAVDELGASLKKYFSDKQIQKNLDKLILREFVKLDGDNLSVCHLGFEALKPYRVERAIILAAGKGERMRPATNDTPKPLVEVNGVSFIETQIRALLQAEITDITVVIGYHAEKFKALTAKYPTIKLINNRDYDISNNAVSTRLASSKLKNCYILEGDLFIYNPDVIRKYEYRNNYCFKKVGSCVDWYFETTKSGVINGVQYGKKNQAKQYIGLSYWDAKSGKTLQNDLDEVLSRQSNYQEFIEAIPFKFKKQNYEVFGRALDKSDIIEVDTFAELCELDPSYKIHKIDFERFDLLRSFKYALNLRQNFQQT